MRIRAAIATVLVGLTVTACSPRDEATPAITTSSTDATPSTTTWTPIAVPTPRPTAAVQDFAVELKVISKKCFGSAGCNVMVEPVIKYLGSLSAETACDLTYSVSGDESGETIETAQHVQGNNYRVRQTMLSTKSTKVVPAATMVRVDCR